MGPFSDESRERGIVHDRLAGGAVIEDFDGDGLHDIAVSSVGPNDSVRLYKNTGGGKFVDWSEQARLIGITGGLNLNVTDYNNDGAPDLMIQRGGWNRDSRVPGSLLRNDGHGVFKDVTIESGLYSEVPSQAYAWGDYNNDGWIDLFVGREAYPKTAATLFPTTVPWLAPDSDDRPSQLFLNMKDGTFRDVTAVSEISVRAVVKGVVWGDVNNDGLLDLYLSTYGSSNRLFINQGEQAGWRFKEQTRSAGVGLPTAGFPTWMWDFNNDGWLDIAAFSNDIVVERALGFFYDQPFTSEPSQLYINNRDGSFSKLPRAQNETFGFLVMGGAFGDLNSDGWLDGYVGTGAPPIQSILPNLVLLNHGGEAIEDVRTVTAQSRLGHLQKGHGIAIGDIENSGSEMVFANFGGMYLGDTFHSALFVSSSRPKSWIGLKLVGVRSNRIALGARVKIVGRDRRGRVKAIFRALGSGSSFGSNTLRLTIALDFFKKIEHIEIHWPGQPASSAPQRVNQFQLNAINVILEK